MVERTGRGGLARGALLLGLAVVLLIQGTAKSLVAAWYGDVASLRLLRAMAGLPVETQEGAYDGCVSFSSANLGAATTWFARARKLARLPSGAHTDNAILAELLQGDCAEAIRLAEGSAASGRRPSMAYLRLGDLAYSLGEVPKAMSYWRRAMVSASLFARRAMALTSAGRYSDAERMLVVAVGVYQAHDLAATQWLEQAFGALGDDLAGSVATKDAIRVYLRGADAIPHRQDLRVHAAILLRSQGQYDEAESQLRAAAFPPNTYSAWAYLELGRTLTEAGRLDQAIDAYSQAVQLAPDSPGYRVDLAVALRGSGAVQESLDELATAVALSDDPGLSSWAYQETGNSQLMLDDVGGACRSYARALELLDESQEGTLDGRRAWLEEKLEEMQPCRTGE